MGKNLVDATLGCRVDGGSVWGLKSLVQIRHHFEGLLFADWDVVGDNCHRFFLEAPSDDESNISCVPHLSLLKHLESVRHLHHPSCLL